MPPRAIVILLLTVACARRPAEPARPEVTTPDATPTPTATTTAQPMTSAAPNLVLTRDQRAPLALGSTATIHYDGLVIEEIAGSPDGSYPGGSGISLTLVVDGGPAPQRRSVSLLSTGYTSRRAAWFDDRRVTLLDVEDPYRQARVALLVERVTGDVLPGAPVEARVAVGGMVALDADTRVEFLGNSTKSISAGERPPLMIALRYHVAGEEPATTEFNAGTDDRALTWVWRDRRFTVTRYAYDEWMQLRIDRLRLAPAAQAAR